MIRRVLLKILNIYQTYIRIILPSVCRFQPTCSEYARQAVVKYGSLKGSIKAAQRLLCCHPFSKKAGYDPLL
ncbi:MAG: membrane protein insertion efficiency factor YidD [Candidatus Omnitrophota bacterium]|nr:membrane protein insertion efficiency factor YidD [Candidatus Omnitrophota bacterium]